MSYVWCEIVRMTTPNHERPGDTPKYTVVFESELPPERKRQLQRRRDTVGAAMGIPGGVQLMNGEPVRALICFVSVVIAYLICIPAGVVLHLISWCFLDTRRGSQLDRLVNDPW